MSNLLFICSKNQWRSPTAEMLFKGHAVHNARSAGTSDKARIKINEKLLNWADMVFVMERKHTEILKTRFPITVAYKKVRMLDIEDNYQFGDTELIAILRKALADYL
ncbi:MAG: protein tyrosine phosphatase [Mucilaginibacter sp.]|nr:protein tyrosine phosphatase [Mucilaginibacter sp.]